MGCKKILVVKRTASNDYQILNRGEIFLLRDLFKGYEWNRISNSGRLLLGTLFLNYIKSNNVGIALIEKTSSR